MSKFLKRVYGRIRRVLCLPLRKEKCVLLGHEYMILEGSLREAVDYDDAWLVACALHSEIVFDIGAHVGDSALMMLLSKNVKEIVLVEANPKALDIASKNLTLNRLSSCAKFYSAFAGKEDGGEVEFWTLSTGAAGSKYKTHAVSASKKNQYMAVPTITVDTLSSKFDLIPDLIKIDVEGAENEVLEGSKNICSDHRKTRILVEMHSNPEIPMPENAKQVLSWCQAVRYSAWYLKEGSLLQSVEPIAQRGRCHLLLQPAEWEYPSWLKGISQGDPLEKLLKLFPSKKFRFN